MKKKRVGDALRFAADQACFRRWSGSVEPVAYVHTTTMLNMSIFVVV